jgi:hypothetical protein
VTAFKGGKPDRVPVVARMWKFLRNYYRDVEIPQRIFKAADELNLDIWDYGHVFPLPVFSPTDVPWRNDVEVHMRREEKDGYTYYRRTITTPAGELSDVKMRAPKGPVYGNSPGPEIVEPLLKDVAKDLDKIRYMMPDVSLSDMSIFKNRTAEVGDRGVRSSTLSAYGRRTATPAGRALSGSAHQGRLDELRSSHGQLMLEGCQALSMGYLEEFVVSCRAF